MSVMETETQMDMQQSSNFNQSSIRNTTAASASTSERRNSTSSLHEDDNSNRSLIALIVYFALLLDNVLLTVIGKLCKLAKYQRMKNPINWQFGLP